MGSSKAKTRIKINLDMTPWAEALAEAMTAADILGRIRVLIEAARKIPVNPMGQLAGATFAEILGFEAIKPTDAIGFLQNLTPFTRCAWGRLAPQYRMAAFTVAKVENLMLVERTRDLLAQSLDEGWTKQQFIDALNKEFDAAGVTRLNSYHLDTVYQTNMQTAYMNGRIKQMADPDVAAALPFWRYRTMEDELVRPNHAALDGFVARASDGVWGRIAPPNGYNCRCTLEPLLGSEARGILGIEIDIPGAARLPAGGGPDDGFGKAPGSFLRSLAAGEKFAEAC